MGYTINKQYQKSVLNAYTSTDQLLEPDQEIDFNSINILNGCSISFVPGTSTINLKKPGVYFISVDAIVEPDDNGTVTMQLQKNNIKVDGAKASFDATEKGEIGGMSFSTIVKVPPSCCMVDNTASLKILNLETNAIYSNANITVMKLC